MISTAFHCFTWISLDSMTSIDFPCIPLISKDFNEFLWFPLICTDLFGFPLLLLDSDGFHGFQWFPLLSLASSFATASRFADSCSLQYRARCRALHFAGLRVYRCLALRMIVHFPIRRTPHDFPLRRLLRFAGLFISQCFYLDFAVPCTLQCICTSHDFTVCSTLRFAFFSLRILVRFTLLCVSNTLHFAGLCTLQDFLLSRTLQFAVTGGKANGGLRGRRRSSTRNVRKK